jgi:hypothetical protein
MAEPHLVGALRKKRAEIVGRIISLEKEFRQRRADLRHLDATLRLFAPNLALSSSRNGLFRRGECSRRVLTVLRGAEQSLTTWDITDQLLAAKRVSPSDTQTRNALHKTVLAALNGGKNKGFIERIDSDQGAATNWRIIS